MLPLIMRNPYAIWYAAEPFELTRIIPVVPAPVVAISNVSRVIHTHGQAIVARATEYPRVLLEGDWT